MGIGLFTLRLLMRFPLLKKHMAGNAVKNEKGALLMRNVIALLAATALASIATGAYADEASASKSDLEQKDNGGYESTSSSESTDANGTTVTTDDKTDVDMDANGNIKKKVVDNEKTIDPKGLWNKKTEKDKTVYEEKKNGGYQQTTIHSYKDRDGESIYYKTVTNVDVDSHGNVITTAKTERTTEPKGWFSSKHTASSESKTVNGVVVEQNSKAN